MVVTGADVAKHDKAFRLYGAIYPFVWAFSQLDALVPACGYMLIATARRRGSRPRSAAASTRSRS